MKVKRWPIESTIAVSQAVGRKRHFYVVTFNKGVLHNYPPTTSDESISLTAPSTAETYYYGACVDAVSGEPDTGNNCSSAARVTVIDSQMETERFDLDPNNGDPSGIAFANNGFYVVDYTDDKVYVLNSTASPDFDLFISFADLHYSLISSPGDPIEMSVTVANLGPHGSPPAKLRFGSSTYRDIPALDPPANGIIGGTGSRVRVGSARVGTLTFRACIVEAPGEQNTSNNCVSRSVTFR